MSTATQADADILNARSWTGPRTAEGKARSSKNAISHGLFTAGDFIRPGEESQYEELKAALLGELAPSGVLERNLADEIRRAIWRLRRCGMVEANIVVGLDDGNGVVFDPMEGASPAAEKAQRSVDRARAQAHRLLHKCTAELRRLQTDRQSADTRGGGTADTQRAGTPDAPVAPPAEQPAASPVAEFTKRTGPAVDRAPEIARNAPCPCKSGLKYKRCCGHNAPAMLHAA